MSVRTRNDFRDPYAQDQEGGYLSALNDQLAPEDPNRREGRVGVSGWRVGEDQPSPGRRIDYRDMPPPSSPADSYSYNYGGRSPQPNASPRDQALGQISQTYSDSQPVSVLGAPAPAPAAAPADDLFKDWQDYQAGRKTANDIRDISMDDWDPEQFADTGDTGANHRQLAKGIVARGLADDEAAVLAELTRTGGQFLYRPGQKRTFGAGAPVDSYNKENQQKRAEGKLASDLGHALPDSTDLSRAGWQNVTQPMREQFRDQGFIPQAPASEQYAQTGNAPMAPPTASTPGQQVPGAPAPAAQQAIPPALQQLIDNATASQQAQQAQRQKLSEILMGQLGKVSTDVSAEDPTLAPLLAAQRLSGQREADRSKAAAAERRAAMGLRDSGAMETDMRGIDEATAERNQGFQAQTLYDELGNRRGAVQNLLGQAYASNNADAALSAGTTLAALNQQMQGDQFSKRLGFDERGLAQQGSQFDRSMAQGERFFDKNLGYNYAGLNQNQNQFDASRGDRRYEYDNTQGFNWAQLENSGNLQALLALLGAA